MRTFDPTNMSQVERLHQYGSPFLTGDMIAYPEVKTADELHEKGKSKLAKIIVNTMLKRQRKKNLPLLDHNNWHASHVGFMKWEHGSLWVYSAVANGFGPQLYSAVYAYTDHVILRSKEYTDDEVAAMVQKCTHLVGINWSYQFWALFADLLYALWGWSWYARSSDKFVVCYEGLRRILDVVFIYGHNMEKTMYDMMRNPSQIIVRDRREPYLTT